MCERVIQLTDRGEKLRKYLIALFITYNVLLIIRIIFLTSILTISSMIIDSLFMSSIIICHFRHLSYLIVLFLYDFYASFSFIGINLQFYLIIKDTNQKVPFYIGVIIEGLNLLLVCIIIYWVFQTYKEFKFIYFGNSHYRK